MIIPSMAPRPIFGALEVLEFCGFATVRFRGGLNSPLVPTASTVPIPNWSVCG